MAPISDHNTHLIMLSPHTSCNGHFQNKPGLASCPHEIRGFDQNFTGRVPCPSWHLTVETCWAQHFCIHCQSWMGSSVTPLWVALHQCPRISIMVHVSHTNVSCTCVKTRCVSVTRDFCESFCKTHSWTGISFVVAGWRLTTQLTSKKSAGIWTTFEYETVRT